MTETQKQVRAYTSDYNLCGYPLFYVWEGEAYCAKCVNENIQADVDSGLHPDDCVWLGNEEIGGGNINWENPDLYCCQCSARLPSAYAEPESEDG